MLPISLDTFVHNCGIKFAAQFIKLLQTQRVSWRNDGERTGGESTGDETTEYRRTSTETTDDG
jgi:hypothetical protein